MIITHVGGPTALVEVEGWRLLTDPTFDPAGGHYAFGWGTASDKTTGPAVALGDLPPVDVVLLTHDHHGDNLDTAGRALLPGAGTVVTTVAGARRLGLPSARGLAPGQVTRISAPGRPDLDVLATPARHGPPLSRPVVGDVVGFAVRRADDDRVLLWVTGDTVLHGGLRRFAAGLSVDVLLVHVGGVRFPVSGPVRYTMTGRQAVALVDLVRPRVAVPVHYDGWSHFRDGAAGLDAAIRAAPRATRARIRRLVPGAATDVGALTT
ncbi:MAG: MBL fold metallo-hydrolase [Actinobacteria bacterium]|nr:MBL fold metallo-hydrolase [Actinomycetota bacterium]